MSFSWIDILLGIIIILFLVQGYREGFVRGVLNLVVLFAAIVGAKIFCTPVVDYISKHTQWITSLESWANGAFSHMLDGKLDTGEWISNANLELLPSSLQDFVFGFTDNINKQIGDVSQVFSEKIALLVATIISFIVIFIVLLIVGHILIRIIDRLTKLPLLNGANKGLGTLVGLVKGLVVVAIISTLFHLASISFANEMLTTAVNESFLMKYFYLGLIEVPKFINLG